MTAVHGQAKILIVDDQDFNIRLLERILQQAGYRNLRGITDSRRVLPSFQEDQPDLILLDLMMPNLDGTAVLNQLTPLAEGTYLPVLVLTADVGSEARRRALSAGAKDFLLKPFDAVEVLLRIHNLLETRFLYRRLQEHADRRLREQGALLEGAHDENKKLTARLRQAERLEAIGSLAGGVAHDFNNLLTIILGYSDIALNKLGADHPVRELLRQVRDAGHRAAGLTRQLLAFSRQQVLAPVVLDLNARVREAEQMLRRLIGEDISLVVDLDPALRPVKVDPTQLDQVLLNLVANARDAMPKGGMLKIATRNVGPEAFDLQAPAAPAVPGGVLLLVSDTGCGMDAATRERIFEPFFTTKEPGKGTGLGLATVYGIVQQSGGIIEVESEPGRGATFKIVLPQLSQPLASLDALQAELEALPHGTGTLLLVEDEEKLRSLGGLTLRSAGYTVLEARDGEEGLRVFEDHAGTIDLLVTDVAMPRMSGRQLAERITAVRPATKVLYMTGYTDDAVVRHGLDGQTAALLQKPFTPLALANKVNELLVG